PVQIARATVIDPTALASEEEARAWLSALDPQAAARDAVSTLNRLLAAQRLAAADPHARELGVSDALALRAGFGAGEQVADGRWRKAVSLPAPRASLRERHRQSLTHTRVQERLVALIAGRSRAMLCEELVLRARNDLDARRLELAAVELERAGVAALREIPRLSRMIAGLLDRLDGEQALLAELAGQALTGGRLPPDADSDLTRIIELLESALRAFSAAGG
ncbi:MAG: hypothetical protein ACYCSI_14335, partial [Solirubrobacteraceae bacterium]